MSTSNKRIKSIDPILPPRALLSRYPVSARADKLITQTRHNIAQIIHFNDPRLLVVVGPCSIHDVDAAMEYANRLLPVRKKLSNELEIVMRVYFEKPRSTIGWKGLINDPHLDNSFDVNNGLELARKLLIDLNDLGMPAGCEFLDAVTGQYYADLVSWGAIGARTTESQIHRELASGLSCPVGFKNGTNGNIDIAADAIVSARTQHVFLSPTEQGQTGLFTTTGNDDAHIILRGGKQPNYHQENVNKVSSELHDRGISTGVMIDCSHANSQKQFAKQIEVGKDIANQLRLEENGIIGCMLESHLIEGNQPANKKEKLIYGKSITDACLGFEDTEILLKELAEAVYNKTS